jgi:predicted nucleotidyltransferase
MNIDHLKKLTPQLMEIAKKYGISRIYVFGSAARGDSTSQSDVDLLVEMEAGASLFGVAGFNFDAEKLLGVQVDVVPACVLLQVRDREFVKNIQREAISL